MLRLGERREVFVLRAARAHGQVDPALGWEEGERHRLRRRPRPRPVRGGDGHAQAVTRGNRVRREVEGDAPLVASSGLQHGRLLVALAVCEVEEPAGDQRRRPVREDIAEAYADERLWAVDRERKDRLGEAEELEGAPGAVRSRRRAKARRPAAGRRRGRPTGLPRTRRPPPSRRTGRRGAAPTRSPVAPARTSRRGATARTSPPPSFPASRIGRLRSPGPESTPEHRLVHDARVDALEPVVPPAEGLLEETDAGPGGRRPGTRAPRGR